MNIKLVLAGEVFSEDWRDLMGERAGMTRPAYDSATLELVGTGSFHSAKKRPLLKVTVCLRHRVGARFFDVRCATAEGSGHKVSGQAVVPGCVAGARACPPEDCGGPPGYDGLLRALAAPDEPESR